ncbi:hypothetical protein JCM11957_12050 [Caminibacter profundus]
MKIIANSLPKSGTHVLVRILELIGLKANKIHFSGSLIRRTSSNPLKNLIKYLKVINCNQGVKIDLDIEHCIKTKYFEKLLINFPENTFSQAHMPFDDKIIKYLEKYNIKMIYIIRDPRDVLVSHFHHHLRDKGYEGHYLMKKLKSDKDRIIASLHGFNQGTQFETAPLKKRLKNSIPWYFIKSPFVFSLKFEDIIGEKGGGDKEKQLYTLKKLERFLEIDENYLVNRKDSIFFEKSSTFRKGQIGDWKNYLDEDIYKLIYDEIGEFIEILGYDND